MCGGGRCSRWRAFWPGGGLSCHCG
ncbi:hypothetical protein MJ568_12065 [Escherichia coli]|nr:hypothetical protein MJ568_12065 [Escherichia coli]